MPGIPQQRPTIRHDFLIAGEGSADKELFTQLCVLHGIADYQVESYGGNKNLELWLVALDGWTNAARLRLIIVVADCDESPQDSFSFVRKCLKKAKLPQPNNPFEIARQNGRPSTMVVMIPFTPPSTGNKGCLESLLLQAARDQLSDYVDCVDQFSECVEVDSWKLTAHADKMKLRVLLSGANEDDPNIGVNIALLPEKNLIPVNHACFEPLVTILLECPTKL